jgi:hypothetical protein
MTGIGIYMTGGNKSESRWRRRGTALGKAYQISATMRAPSRSGLAIERACTTGYKGCTVGVGWVKGTSNTDRGGACAERAFKYLTQRKTEEDRQRNARPSFPLTQGISPLFSDSSRCSHLSFFCSPIGKNIKFCGQ